VQQVVGFNPPEGLTPLAPDNDIWIDLKRKLVVADGRVALNIGALEMFACPKGTKEHESLIAIDGKASLVHAGLLAVGAEPGSAVQFEPEYRAATGSVIDIFVLYRDQEGNKKKVPAKQWIRNTKTGKEIQHSWVFVGSGFWKDPADSRKYYYADGGDFICVSNFPTATLDLPIPSSQANDALLFEVFEGRVPPRGTPVRLVLIPRESKPAKPSSTSDDLPNEERSQEGDGQ
jgi:hypothetical protein